MIFVSYTWGKNGRSFGFGNANYSGSGIFSYDDLKLVSEKVLADLKNSDPSLRNEEIIVVILNWRKYDSPE